jgi:hypothetical protein
MVIEIVKGFRDIFPPESLKRKKIKDVIEENMILFGFTSSLIVLCNALFRQNEPHNNYKSHC